MEAVADVKTAEEEAHAEARQAGTGRFQGPARDKPEHPGESSLAVE